MYYFHKCLCTLIICLYLGWSVGGGVNTSGSSYTFYVRCKHGCKSCWEVCSRPCKGKVCNIVCQSSSSMIDQKLIKIFHPQWRDVFSRCGWKYAAQKQMIFNHLSLIRSSIWKTSAVSYCIILFSIKEKICTMAYNITWYFVTFCIFISLLHVHNFNYEIIFKMALKPWLMKKIMCCSWE